MSLLLRATRTYPVAVDTAYDVVLAVPLERLFRRRFGPLPPVRGADGQQGPWGTVGQTRTVRLADGGTMRETLTVADRPAAFGYTIDTITGPMRPLVGAIVGLWTFDPVGTGVRIGWQWTVDPASPAAGVAMPAFARLWRGYARQALEEAEEVLLAQA